MTSPILAGCLLAYASLSIAGVAALTARRLGWKMPRKRRRTQAATPDAITVAQTPEPDDEPSPPTIYCGEGGTPGRREVVVRSYAGWKAAPPYYGVWLGHGVDKYLLHPDAREVGDGSLLYSFLSTDWKTTIESVAEPGEWIRRDTYVEGN